MTEAERQQAEAADGMEVWVVTFGEYHEPTGDLEVYATAEGAYAAGQQWRDSAPKRRNFEVIRTRLNKEFK